MKNCVLCSSNIIKENTTAYNQGVLQDGSEVCKSCHRKHIGLFNKYLLNKITGEQLKQVFSTSPPNTDIIADAKMPTSQKILVGCFALVIILSMGSVAYFMLPSIWKAISTPAPPTKPDIHKAYIISQDAVKSVLLSPSTADFPFMDYRGTEYSPGRFIIDTQVDSQNGFGAMIRSEFRVHLSYIGGDWANSNNWTIEDIEKIR